MTGLAQDLDPTEIERTTDVPAAPRAGWRGKLLSIRGRCGVRSYHARLAALFAALVPPTLVLSGAAVMNGGDETVGASFVVGMTVFTLALIAVLASSVCVTVQRLHDLGHSGWLYLVGFVPIVNLLFTLYFCYVPGGAETNRFGAPHEPSGASRVAGPISIGLGLLLVAAYVVGVLVVPAPG